MSEEKNRRGGLPALYNVTPEQLKVVAGAVLTSGVADIAFHNPAILIGSLLFTGGAAWMSPEIVEMIVPGANRDAVVNATHQTITALSPEPEIDPYKDQSTLAKLKRLAGMKTPPVLPESKPKDDTFATGTDESEEEAMPPVSPLFPVYPKNERLDLGHVLATGQTFAPHFNALFGKGVIASAVQGSGKSQLLGRLIEQAAKCGVPMVVCDHKGEYAPVTELPFVNGLRAGSAELRGQTEDCRYFELTTKNADQFVAQVMMYRYQAIIDLPSYGDSWLARAEIVAEVGQALMRYAAKQRKMGALLLPCLVALDEAQLYLPQNVNLLPPEAKKSTEVLDSLNNAYFALVSNGRSNGYTVVFATQSLTYIAKWAIKSCQIKIFGRHVEKNDLDMCGDIINPKVATRADIETFAPGVGVVFGFTPQPVIVKFELRQSRDDSETPGLERLRMPAQPVQYLSDLPDGVFDEEESSVSMHELCEAVIEMAGKRYKNGEIMRMLGLYAGEYQDILDYIQLHRSEFRSVTPAMQITPTRANLSVVHPELREAPGSSATLPDYSENAPTEHSESNSGMFLARGDDLLLSELQAELLKVFYRDCNNVNKSLEQIKNDRGQGLGGRYTRHASFILEQAGLKKRRA